MKRGELLSDKRIEKGFSVSVLAQKLGVAETDVERWEAGELPDSKHLLALSALLDIPVEDILQGGIAAEEGEGGCVQGRCGRHAPCENGRARCRRHEQFRRRDSEGRGGFARGGQKIAGKGELLRKIA